MTPTQDLKLLSGCIDRFGAMLVATDKTDDQVAFYFCANPLNALKKWYG